MGKGLCLWQLLVHLTDNIHMEALGFIYGVQGRERYIITPRVCDFSAFSSDQLPTAYYGLHPSRPTPTNSAVTQARTGLEMDWSISHS